MKRELGPRIAGVGHTPKLLGELAGLWFAWLIDADIHAEIHAETA